jgi:hypothetical protein
MQPKACPRATAKQLGHRRRANITTAFLSFVFGRKKSSHHQKEHGCAVTAVGDSLLVGKELE